MSKSFTGIVAGISALVLFTGPASADAPEGFKKTSETLRCLSFNSIRDMDAIGNGQFLVRVRGGKYYLNQASGRCSGAEKNGTRIEYKTPTASLCKGQIIQVVDNTSGIGTGSCTLGTFVKLERVAE